MEMAKKISQVALSVLLWIVILLAALFAFTTLASRNDNEISTFGGFAPMVVKSDSMKPTFCAGDLILIKKCDTNSLKVGDIITFHTIIENEYALNTHRIAEITEASGVRSYTTKGDNNEVSDTHFITDGDIVGQYVVKLPGMGKVMDFLSSSTGFLLVIVLPMILFLIYQIYHLIMVSMRLKKAVAAEAAQAQSGSDMDAAEKARMEAEAALAEAKRIKEEAEAALRAAKGEAPAEEAPAEEASAEEAPAEEAPAEEAPAEEPKQDE